METNWLDHYFTNLQEHLARRDFDKVNLAFDDAISQGFSFHQGFALLVTTRFYRSHLPSYERVRNGLVDMVDKEPVDDRSKSIARRALDGMK